jgi:hypothetical protein
MLGNTAVRSDPSEQALVVVQTLWYSMQIGLCTQFARALQSAELGHLEHLLAHCDQSHVRGPLRQCAPTVVPRGAPVLEVCLAHLELPTSAEDCVVMDLEAGGEAAVGRVAAAEDAFVAWSL